MLFYSREFFRRNGKQSFRQFLPGVALSNCEPGLHAYICNREGKRATSAAVCKTLFFRKKQILYIQNVFGILENAERCERACNSDRSAIIIT